MISPRWIKVIRDIWSNKSRTILVILSIAIGVFAFGGLFTGRSLIVNNLDRDFLATNPSDIDMSFGKIDDLLIHWMERQPYVTNVQTFTTRSAEFVINGEISNAQLIAYEDYENIRMNTFEYESGLYPPERNEMILERSFLDDLGVQVGQTVTLRTANDKLHQLQIVGTVHSLHLPPGSISVPVYVTERTLFGMGLSVDKNNMEITVQKNDAPPPAEIASTLRDDLTDLGVMVGSITVNNNAGFWAKDILAGVIAVLVVIGLASLMLSAFLVVNTISGIMAQQRKQIGIMKIIGADRMQIIVIYLVMVTILGLIAFAIALPSSVILARELVTFFAGFLNFNVPPIEIPLEIALIELAVAILVPVLSALMPILSGTSVTAAETISDHNVISSNNPLDVLLAKLSGFSRPVLLMVRNTFRQKIRLAVTIFTLIFAGTTFISIMNVRNGLLADVNELLRMALFDIQITFTQPYNVDGLERRILEYPNIVGIESWSGTSVTIERPDRSKSETVSLIGTYSDTIFAEPKIREGQWLPPYSPLDRRSVVVSDAVLEKEPWLGIGDTITLQMGFEEEDWTIIGILDEDNESIYSYYESVSRFTNTVNKTADVRLDMDPSIDPSQFVIVADDLTKYLEERGFEVGRTVLLADIIVTITNGFDSLVYMLLGMAVLIAIVAGLGLAGTMSLNVLERTREIGVMRAVGAGNMSIRLMFVGEGVLIGLLSFIVALPLSIAGTIGFSNLLGIVLFDDPLTIIMTPIGIFVWLAIVLSVSTVASIAPANRASQISIREAISYE